MQIQYWLAVITLTPSLASAALFPKDTLVKQIDAKAFKAAMKENVRACPASILPHIPMRDPRKVPQTRAPSGLWSHALSPWQERGRAWWDLGILVRPDEMNVCARTRMSSLVPRPVHRYLAVNALV